MDTLVELLMERADEDAERQIYRFLDEHDEVAAERTFAELDRAARRVGAMLQGLCAPGDRVLLCFDPGPAFIEAFLGCAYANTIAVPAYPPRQRANLARLESITQDCAPALALHDQSADAVSRDALGEVLGSLHFVSTDDLVEGSEMFFTPAEVSGADTCFLQYTSGSTGVPKGVEVTHANLLHNLASTKDSFKLSRDDRGLFWLPPYHDMGLIGGLLQPLYSSMPSVMAPPAWFIRRPERWIQAMSKYRATVSGAPTFAYGLAAQRPPKGETESIDLSAWTLAFVGAEPVRKEVLSYFANVFAPHGFRPEALYPCYGMAEATLLVTGVAREEAPRAARLDRDAYERGEAVETEAREGTFSSVGCGVATGGQTVIVVDPELRVPVPEGATGEIWVHGGSVAKGYWNRPELTEERFGAELASSWGYDVPSGPYLRTGDKGFFLDGQLHICGRLKDMVIVRGRNFYAEDVEAIAFGSHPALRAGGGAAFGVDRDGTERMVLVHEVVSRDVPLEEVRAAVQHRLASELGLFDVEVVFIRKRTLVKTTSGKVMRFAARQSYLDNTLATISSPVPQTDRTATAA